MNPSQREHIRQIAQAALRRVDPYQMIIDAMTLEEDQLTISTATTHDVFDLTPVEEILILGAGKAGAPMVAAVEEILGDRITAGVVSVKEGHAGPASRVTIVEAGHPIPNEGGIRAADEILSLAARAGKRSLVINLISGGGSALLVAPAEGLSLADIQATTKALLDSGAEIHEINTLRKHLSRIKGGQLAAAIAPAQSVSLILSDVVGDDLDAIASGVTVGDSTTFGDAIAIVEKYAIGGLLPESVRTRLQSGAAGQIPDTPKPGDAAMKLANNVLVGTNYEALIAAEEAAAAVGYAPLILTSRLTGEARDAARFLGSIAAEAQLHDRPAPRPCCILSGGETTVTISGTGTGGRNQEMALAFLRQIEQSPERFDTVAFASVATDGTDGPTDAAGAFASVAIAERARAAGLSIHEYLANNDSFRFFEALGELYRTGPTHTNVCDLQIILVGTP